MNRIVTIVLVLVILAISAALLLRTRQAAGRRELREAFGGREPVSVRNIRVHHSGLRESVAEIFFYADPTELERVLNTAPFQQNNIGLSAFQAGNTHFKSLSGLPLPQAPVGFVRSDLGMASRSYCHVVTDPQYSFAYVIYVEF